MFELDVQFDVRIHSEPSGPPVSAASVGASQLQEAGTEGAKVRGAHKLLRRAEALQRTCRQNEKSMKRREKPQAVISCNMMTTMRDGVLEF